MQHSVRLASPIGAVVLIATLAVVAASAAASIAGVAPASLAAAAFALLAITIAVGVIVPSAGIFARPVLGAISSGRELALTFDDGPDPRWTPQLLDLLDARGHRATFFVIGERAAQHEALVTEMSRRGHEIANHSWSHSPVTVFVPPKQLARELERANDLIERTAGIRPRWFRAPVGLLSPRIAPAVREARLRLVHWTATARDGVASTTADQAFARLDRGIVPGSVLVMHDAALRGNREPVALEVLRRVLDRMDAASLRSVTLSELCGLGLPGAKALHGDGDDRADHRSENRAKRESTDRPRE